MSSTVSLTSVISRSPGIIAEPLEGGIVMLDPERDRYLRLNATGKLLWEALEEPASVEALARKLESSAGIEPAQADADALAFASALVDQGAASAAP